MKVFIAADHTGFELKNALIVFLEELGHRVEDCGAFVLDAADDYPDFVTPCAEKVAGEMGSFGVVIGASGQGEAMAANRISGVRAAVYYGDTMKTQVDADGVALDMISSVRSHNDANILSLAARFVSEEDAKKAVRQFVESPFSGAARHKRRIEKF